MPAKEVSFPVSSSVLPRIFCLVSAADDLALLPALAEAGIDGFQIRDHGATTRELMELARIVRAAVKPSGATVVVNDRLDVALTTGADGVHLGAEDLPVSAAARLAAGIAPRLIIGATCRDAAAVRRAAVEGATYAGFGPVFTSGSKPGLPSPRGLDAVTAASGSLPLIAIGGIDAANAAAARAAGAHGVAVIGAIWRQPDPLIAAKELVRAVA